MAPVNNGTQSTPPIRSPPMNVFVPLHTELHPASLVRSALVVEGNALHSAPVSKKLGRNGVDKVRVADDGVAAIAALRRREWDLVVLDLDLPQSTGLQLIDILADRGSSAAVVLTSARSSRVLQAAASYAGGRGVDVVAAVRRPMELPQLKTILQELAFGPRSTHAPVINEGKGAMEFSTEELRDALRLQQIAPYFQPQHSIQSGALRGAELLARWHHPDGSVLTPAAFLEAFAEHGLLEALTDYMLASAFECLATDGGLGSRQIAVNVPAVVADSVHWAQSVADRAIAAGVDPARLVIEITEDGGKRCNQALVGAVTQLRLRGFSCAIDDFGSGSSSLERLLQVPFSELKIERGMIAQARTHAHVRSVLASIVAMGKQLVTTVVAEGVEDAADLEMVRALGCQVSQGYLHAKPMSRDAYLDYCARHSC